MVQEIIVVSAMAYVCSRPCFLATSAAAHYLIVKSVSHLPERYLRRLAYNAPYLHTSSPQIISQGRRFSPELGIHSSNEEANDRKNSISTSKDPSQMHPNLKKCNIVF